MEDFISELQALTVHAPEFTTRQLTNPNNKWLVRSAFQKAIRRGQTDNALRYGEYLLGVDQTYAWQALATVVIEDVGFGDADLVAYSCMTTLKSLRDQVEAEMLFAAMIQKACDAPKSRSCCELDLGYNMRRGEWDEKNKTFPGTAGKFYLQCLHMPVDYLIELIQSTTPKQIDGLENMHAAVLALRKQLRGEDNAALIPALTMIRDTLEEHGPSIQRAAMFSFERTVDTMNLALYPILRWICHQPIANTYEKSQWPRVLRL